MCCQSFSKRAPTREAPSPTDWQQHKMGPPPPPSRACAMPIVSTSGHPTSLARPTPLCTPQGQHPAPQGRVVTHTPPLSRAGAARRLSPRYLARNPVWPRRHPLRPRSLFLRRLLSARVPIHPAAAPLRHYRRRDRQVQPESLCGRQGAGLLVIGVSYSIVVVSSRIEVTSTRMAVRALPSPVSVKFNLSADGKARAS